MPAVGLGAEGGFEFAPLAAAAVLGAVERHVCGAEQVLGGIGMVRKDGDTDRRPDDCRMPFEHDRLAAVFENAFGLRAGKAVRIRTAEDDGELVAAEPGDDALAVDRRTQPVADLDEHRIARAVTERIVDGLEAIEIEDEEREFLLPRDRRGNAGGERRVESGAVGKAGQRVAIGEHFQPLIGTQDIGIGRRQRVGERRRLQLSEHIADEDGLPRAAAADQDHGQRQDVESEQPAADVTADGK